MKTLISSEYAPYVKELVKKAQKSIDICMYDWRIYFNNPENPIQQVNLELIRAAQRGVRVRALLNTDLVLDYLKNFKIKARTLKDNRVLHSKFIIIDEKILVIGSHNMTSNAISRNLETSIVIDIPEGENRIQEFFNNLYGL